MPPLIDKLRKRASETAERAASGSAVPAGIEPEAQERKPRVRERGSMRRRLRELRQRREALLAELGAIVLEMDRQDHQDTGLVERKLAELRSVDDEARALAAALSDGDRLDGVLREGISGACSNCGALMGTDDRFCARCGTAAQPAAPDGKAESDGEAAVDGRTEQAGEAETDRAAGQDRDDQTMKPTGGEPAA